MSGQIRDTKIRTRLAMVDLLDRASAAQPGDLALAQRAASASLEVSDEVRAVAALRRVTEVRPDLAGAWDALANLLHGRNRAAEAVAAFERAVALAPENSYYHSSLGFALRTLGDDARADAVFERAWRLDRANPYAARGHGQALVRSGAAQALADYCEETISHVGARSWLIAQYMIALARLGRREAIAWLLDYDALVDVSLHEGFPGFASRDAFHAALREEFAALQPVASGGVPNDVVRDGIRVPGGPLGAIALFGAEGAPASAALMDAIVAQEARFAARLGDCLLRRARPPRFARKSAGIISRHQGYVAPHTHACSWLTILYYAAVPETVRRGDNGNLGCMMFCPPHHKISESEQALWPSRLIRPEPGMMLIFPGYAYHEVHASADADERIVISVDLHPMQDSYALGVSHETWLTGMPQE